MENEDERNEYILNETGKIWCGTFKNPTGKHWIFDQFDEISLPAAVFLLEKSGLPSTGRGSPILIARALSAIVSRILIFWFNNNKLFISIRQFTYCIGIVHNINKST